MITIDEWMGDLGKHGGDCGWVERNIELLYEAILYGLSHDRLAQDAIEALNLIFGCVIQRDDYRRWEPLLYDALQHAHLLNDTTYQTQIWTQLGQNFLKYGERKAAANAFDRATQHADEIPSAEDILRGRIGSLRTAAIYERDDFAQLAQEILALCRQTASQDLLASAHTSLALAYSFRHESVKAIGHGLTAYALWHHLKASAQKAEVAFTLAESCRLVGLFSQSARFTQIAQSNLLNSDHNHKLAVAWYQTGVLYLTDKQDFVTAESWFQAALDNFIRLKNYPYLTGATYHALGLAQTETGRFQPALDNLRTALIYWRKMENRYERAGVCHAIGYLASKLPRLHQARYWYQRARKLAEQLPESPAKDKLLSEIDKDRDQLNQDLRG